MLTIEINVIMILNNKLLKNLYLQPITEIIGRQKKIPALPPNIINNLGIPINKKNIVQIVKNKTNKVLLARFFMQKIPNII